MAFEARIMEYLHEKGYPVPAVDQLSEDGNDLIMERIHGPTMVEALGQTPWRIGRIGHMLGELHLRLHDLPVPDFLPDAPVGAGSRILHLDLHPLNVIMGPKGPVVIDWPRACRGDPAVDVGMAWLLTSAGGIPGGRLKARLLGLGRSMLANSFISMFDRTQVGAQLGDVVEWKALDTNMSSKEIATMRQLAAQFAP